MSELVSIYKAQAQDLRSSLPWIAELQDKALKRFEESGFPTKHDEEWKYTSVDAVLKQSFAPAKAQVIPSALAVDGPFDQQVVIYNGEVLSCEEALSLMPKGVIIAPLAQALEQHEQLIKPYLAQIIQLEHGFHALNMALLHQGLFIYIPKQIRIEAPIVLAHIQDKPNNAVHLRHLIIAEQHSEATVVEQYQGVGEDAAMTNTISEIFLAADAKLTHYKIQRENKKTYHFGHIAVKQNQNSYFESHSLNLGAALARSDLSIFLHEEHAHCLMNGIYAPAEGQHVDHHTTVHHLVPNCSSKQDYKGIMKGRARAVFNGKVIVSKDAQHTDAQQQNKNLLLSPNAEINTKPQLEIFADDVTCSHGATVGQLDEEALFYLASRGIDRLEGAHYLIHAFAEDNLRLIPNRQLALWMGQLLTEQLG